MVKMKKTTDSPTHKAMQQASIGKFNEVLNDEIGDMREAVRNYDIAIAVLSETYDALKKIDFSVQMWTKYDDIPWEAIEAILGETESESCNHEG
jgi:hypothetical protein